MTVFDLRSPISTTQKAIPLRASPFVFWQEVIEKYRRSVVRASLTVSVFSQKCKVKKDDLSTIRKILSECFSSQKSTEK